jgi:hypothetical protein
MSFIGIKFGVKVEGNIDRRSKVHTNSS